MSGILIALLIILAVLQLGDGLTTRSILARGGRELNPVTRWLIDRLGVDLALGLKSLFAVVLVGVIAHKVEHPIEPYALAGLCALYAWVVWSNWRVLRGMGR